MEGYLKDAAMAFATKDFQYIKIWTQLKILLKNEPALLFQANTDVLGLKLCCKCLLSRNRRIQWLYWSQIFLEVVLENAAQVRHPSQPYNSSAQQYVKISSLNHGTM